MSEIPDDIFTEDEGKDVNTLVRLAPPTPNPLAREASNSQLAKS